MVIDDPEVMDTKALGTHYRCSTETAFTNQLHQEKYMCFFRHLSDFKKQKKVY
jgi:hypothetical protein